MATVWESEKSRFHWKRKIVSIGEDLPEEDAFKALGI